MRTVAEARRGASVATAARAGGAPASAPPPRPARPADATGTLCLPLGLDEEISRDLDRLFVQTRALVRREVLYRAGEALGALHLVRAGTLKTVMLAEDGREQITGYHMAGDIVGLDGIGHPLHACDAIALEESQVRSMPFARLDELASDSRLMNGLFRVMARDMRRNQDLIVLLGSMCAEERLATFLLNLGQRQRARGAPPGDVALCMTREEIASFLGIKLETVSRLFSRLQAEGRIQVQGRAVKLLDTAALQRVASREG
jgi:CRP/FNR family transcriptional regulator